MITSTTGLNLNHGWVKGYRFETGPVPRPLPIEWAENTGRVMVYIIGDTVEWVNIVWRPLGDLLLNGQNNIVDNGNMSVTITADGVEETIVFDPEDEDFYAMLCSNPTIVEKLPGDPNNCFDARVGWKWNGESCYEAQ